MTHISNGIERRSLRGLPRKLLGLTLVAVSAVLVFAAVFDSPRAALRKSGYCDTALWFWLDRNATWLWNPCIDVVPASLSMGGLPVRFHPTERVEGLRIARLERQWRYCHDATGAVVNVPMDFATDFASIPRYARFYADPMGDHIEAAVVHDWLYSVGQDDESLGRYDADDIFRAVLKESGVNLIKRNIMFLAVRVGGEQYFNRGNTIEMRRPDWTKYSVPKPASGIVEVRPHCRDFEGLRPRGLHID